MLKRLTIGSREYGPYDTCTDEVDHYLCNNSLVMQKSVVDPGDIGVIDDVASDYPWPETTGQADQNDHPPKQNFPQPIGEGKRQGLAFCLFDI